MMAASAILLRTTIHTADLPDDAGFATRARRKLKRKLPKIEPWKGILAGVVLGLLAARGVVALFAPSPAVAAEKDEIVIQGTMVSSSEVSSLQGW
jgi:hypothetical protein